jgi:hypothetical protein
MQENTMRLWVILVMYATVWIPGFVVFVCTSDSTIDVEHCVITGFCILFFFFCSQRLSGQPLQVYCAIQGVMVWEVIEGTLPTKRADFHVVWFILFSTTAVYESFWAIWDPKKDIEWLHLIRDRGYSLLTLSPILVKELQSPGFWACTLFIVCELGLELIPCESLLKQMPCSCMKNKRWLLLVTLLVPILFFVCCGQPRSFWKSVKDLPTLDVTIRNGGITSLWIAAIGIHATQRKQLPGLQFCALSIVAAFVTLTIYEEIIEKLPVMQHLFDFAVVVSVTQLHEGSTVCALSVYFFTQLLPFWAGIIITLVVCILSPEKKDKIKRVLKKRLSSSVYSALFDETDQKRSYSNSSNKESERFCPDAINDSLMKRDNHEEDVDPFFNQEMNDVANSGWGDNLL